MESAHPGTFLKQTLSAAGPLLLIVTFAGGLYLSGQFGDRVLKSTDDAALYAQRPSASDARSQFRSLQNEHLKTRYQLVTPEGEWGDILYHEEDFDRVERHLQDTLARASDDWKFWEYSTLCTGLMTLRSTRGPKQMDEVLRRWTERHPDSYYAWLIRGGFHIRHAWRWRGAAFSNQVPDASMSHFKELLGLAHQELEHARDLNPRDSEAPFQLLYVATGLHFDRSAMEAYLDAVTRAAPGHYHARLQKMAYISVRWYGDELLVNDYSKQCARDAERHPLLSLLPFQLRGNVGKSRLTYAVGLFGPERIARWVNTYQAVLKRWPEALLHRSNLAYIAFHGRDSATAVKQFEILGDRYIPGSRWHDLAQYNTSRARANTAYAQSLKGPERLAHLERAAELTPMAAEPVYHMARYWTEENKLDAAEESLRWVVERDPTYPSAYPDLVALLHNTGRQQEAHQLAETALEFPLHHLDVKTLHHHLANDKTTKN